MKQLFSPRFLFVTIAIILAASTRLFAHPFNFTAIGAMALFGGASFSDKRSALLFPLIAMLLSDLVLGFHDTMIYVYPSIILITLLGIYLQKKISVLTVIAGSITSSLLFFLITNFGVWMQGGIYAPTLTGLIDCYIAGLAFIDHSFFGNLALNTVMGDLFFNGILFGSLALASRKFPLLTRI